MPATYEPIATTTLNSDVATIDFNSIPSSYTDLRMVIFADFSGTDATIRARLNNNSNSIYYYTMARGAGSGTGTSESGNTADYLFINGQTQSNGYTFMFTMDIFQYTKTSIAKQIISAAYRNAAPFGGDTNTNIVRFDNTSAISSIQLYANGFNASGRFASGTTVTLFGIQAA